MGKLKSLLSDTAVFAFGNVFTKVLLFILMPIYTTALATEEYGIAELLNNAVELSLPLFTLGITQAVFRFSVDIGADQKQILNIGLSILFKGLAVLILIVAIGNYFIDYEYAWYFIFLFFAYSARYLLANYVRGIGRPKIFVISGCFSAFILLFLNVFFLLVVPLGIRGYLLSITISNLCGAAFLIQSAKLYSYIQISKIDHGLLRSMLRFSLPTIPNLLSWWFVNISARYIVFLYCGASMAGLFTAASKLPAMVHLLTTIFQQSWQYASSKEYGQEGSQQFFSDVYKYFSAFLIVSSSGLIMITPLISKILLKGDFYTAWTYVPLLLLSATLGGHSIFFGTFYIASKKNVMLMVSTVIGAVVNIGTCIFLIPVIGVSGALIASVVSYFIIVIIRIIDTGKYVKVNIRWSFFIVACLLLFIQSLVLMVDISSRYEISALIFIFIMIITIFSFNREIKIVGSKITAMNQR